MKEKEILNDSKELYDEIINSNNSELIYNLALFYNKGSQKLDDYWTYQDRYINLLEKGALLNHIPSLIKLGDTNRRGNDYIAKHPLKAKELYIKASEKGSAKAMLRLANMYEEEFENEDDDWKKSLYWINKACSLNYSEAFIMLGTFYEEGKGVPIDIDKAYELYEKGGAEL